MAKKLTPRSISLTEFFEMTPPGKIYSVKQIAVLKRGSQGFQEPFLNLSPITLYCDNTPCNGLRFFEYTGDRIELIEDEWNKIFVTFHCKNCNSTQKTFAISVSINVEEDEEQGFYGKMLKIGEDPPFGPPIPARVISLIGPDRDLFLMGRRSENQGMGIGAFAYYRRVVENQKNRVIDEIIRVVEKTGTSSDLLKELAFAKNEQQFTKAIDSIKHAIPPMLLINGENPLKLLHSALSEGLHDHTDEKCLELAQDIRIVLTELAERLSQALKDEVELSDAVKRLRQAKGKKTSTLEKD